VSAAIPSHAARAPLQVFPLIRRPQSSPAATTGPMWSDSNVITSAHVDGRSLNPMVNQRSANVAATAIKAMPTRTETAHANR
jgi:hypothetical protein